MALILNLFRSNGPRGSFVTEYELLEILRVVDLPHNLSQTLGCNGAIVGLERANTETLGQEKLFAVCSYAKVSAWTREDNQDSTHQTAAAVGSSLSRTRQSIVGGYAEPRVCG